MTRGSTRSRSARRTAARPGTRSRCRRRGSRACGRTTGSPASAPRCAGSRTGCSYRASLPPWIRVNRGNGGGVAWMPRGHHGGTGPAGSAAATAGRVMNIRPIPGENTCGLRSWSTPASGWRRTGPRWSSTPRPGACRGRWKGPVRVLVTHEHFDHFDSAGLRAALTADPGLQLWTNESVASEFAGFSKDQVHVVDDGDTFTAAGFDVHAYGHLHATLHRDIPVIENTGFHDRRLALPPWRLVHRAAGPGPDPAAAGQRALAQDGGDDRLRARSRPAARVRHPRSPVR